MGLRKWQGMFGAKFSTDSHSTQTPIPNPYSQESGVAFEDTPDDHPKDALSNNYASPDFRVYSYAFLDKTQYDALRALKDADTAVDFEFELDNGELHRTVQPVRMLQLKPMDISGAVQGRSNAYVVQVRLHRDNVNEITA